MSGLRPAFRKQFQEQRKIRIYPERVISFGLDPA
jgi:hypothetical protein